MQALLLGIVMVCPGFCRALFKLCMGYLAHFSLLYTHSALHLFESPCLLVISPLTPKSPHHVPRSQEVELKHNFLCAGEPSEISTLAYWQ